MKWLVRAGVMFGGRMAYGAWRRKQREKQWDERQAARSERREADTGTPPAGA